MRSSHDDRNAAAPLPRAFGPRPLPAARGEVDQKRPSSFTTFRGDPSGVRVRGRRALVVVAFARRVVALALEGAVERAAIDPELLGGAVLVSAALLQHELNVAPLQLGEARPIGDDPPVSSAAARRD